MSPRIHVNAWLRVVSHSEFRNHYFPLGPKACFDACAVREVATHIMQDDSCSTNHALDCVAPLRVKWHKAFGARATILFLLSAVLAKPLLLHLEVQTHTHIEQELNIIEWDGVWSDVGCQPHRILFTTQVPETR